MTTTLEAAETISGAHPLTAKPLTARLFQADCRDVLRSLEDNSVDSVVTDPPYALVSIVKRFGKPGSAPAKGNDAYQRASAGFMGKQWDTGEVAFSDEFWAEVLRVLKPGGHVVAFSGTRTYHRMAVAIEDAGFEVRDQLAWMYGSGFPKSHDVAKSIDKSAGHWRGMAGAVTIESQVAKGAEYERTDKGDPITPDAIKWQGWGTALKPSWEPICLARKPLSEKTVAANVLKWGTGALNIDGCRVGDEERVNPSASRNDIYGQFEGAETDGRAASGRWPANIAHDGSDEVLAGFPETASGTFSGKRNEPKTKGVYGDFELRDERGHVGDSGSAARFFYCAKASRADRDEGLEEFNGKSDSAHRKTNIEETGDNPYLRGVTIRKNTHPTVKPTTLMQWLCRMVTPPGGTVLDPFMGSGSTGKASLREGFDFIGCEREDEYMPIAVARVATGLRLAPKPVAKQPANDNLTGDLFGATPQAETA